jgi:hypothetical protein
MKAYNAPSKFGQSFLIFFQVFHNGMKRLYGFRFCKLGFAHSLSHPWKEHVFDPMQGFQVEIDYIIGRLSELSQVQLFTVGVHCERQPLQSLGFSHHRHGVPSPSLHVKLSSPAGFVQDAAKCFFCIQNLIGCCCCCC